MKLRNNIPITRRQAGVTLIECLVYVTVFAILLGIGTASFCFCWDHTRKTVFVADQIESTLRAGESWRTDIRQATGPISVENSAAGQVVRVPESGREIVYRFAGQELWREIPAQNHSRQLLAKVKTSEMKLAARENVNAWQWELSLLPPHSDSTFPLRFTFEAAQSNP